jgi:exodeoxyribonuclease VII large subunit
MEDRKIYSLSELGKSIRSVIERTYTSTYWIKAEIAKLNFYPRSGHCYPELVDKAGNVIQAQMRSTIWAADYKVINRQFMEITGEPLQEGMSILFRASVGYHPVYGLSLQIWEVEPAFTLGEMALEKSRNIDKLKKEEIFDANRQQEMPLLPKRIAVISVETSKGYHDFLNIMQQHAAGFGWWHYLFPSVLQGEKAVEGIVSQLRIIKKVKNRFDMVAIIRGGGGDIGLSCYDDYQMAREIATFPLPVITGIGHATNITIAEMVAWSNKITPTDVAYFIVERFRDFETRIDNASQIVINRAQSLLAYNRQNAEHLHSRLLMAPVHFVSAARNRFNNISSSLVATAKNISSNQKSRLDDYPARLSVVIPARMADDRNTIAANALSLQIRSKQVLSDRNNHLQQLENSLRLLDPENVLRRGYSLTLLDGKKVKSASDVHTGDLLVTRLHKGEIRSRVTDDEP